MSYCRFSCDNWKSDVYLYEDCAGGWTLHVATNRVVGDVPALPSIEDPTFLEAYRAQHRFLDDASRESIGLEWDGETFRLREISDVHEKLKELKGMGYHVPPHALDAVAQECDEVKR